MSALQSIQTILASTGGSEITTLFLPSTFIREGIGCIISSFHGTDQQSNLNVSMQSEVYCLFFTVLETEALL